MFTRAITRTPAPTFARGLTAANLGEPDYGRMLEQHALYVATLREIGLDVIVLDPLPEFPDAHFVEDVAVVLPDVAMVTIPGAASRRGEAEHIVSTLGEYRRIVRMEAPGTMDGGDVIRAGSHFFVGISERTNEAGAEQFGRFAEERGYTWEPIPVKRGLHLKSTVTAVTDDTLVMTEDAASVPAFAAYRRIVVDEEESCGANEVLLNERILLPTGNPRTRARLEELGLSIVELDVSESRKMDGGLTCLSLRL
jgi:dimethylargininase